MFQIVAYFKFSLKQFFVSPMRDTELQVISLFPLVFGTLGLTWEFALRARSDLQTKRSSHFRWGFIELQSDDLVQWSDQIS